MLDFFKAYDISPKKQISALQITNNTLIKEILKREGVTINKNNEWKFLDNRVEDIFIKYSNFVKDAMEKRDELRTVEKIKVFNENSKILQQISSVRECIDKSNLCDSFRGRTISGSFDPYLTAFGIFGRFIKCDRYKFNSIYYFAAYPKRIAQSI